jgi:drug/metabolite transporter (DMT)-like permease
MMKSALQLQFLVLLLCALYGSVFTIGKITLEYAPPLFITGTRMLLAAFLLLLYQYLFHYKTFIFRREHFWPTIIMGFTSVYLTNALEFWGLQFMESGKACFIYGFSPIATALLSYLWFSEKLTTLKCIGLSLGLFGFLPILIAHSGNMEDLSGKIGFFSYAELAMLGAATTNAIGWMTMRVIIKDRGYTPVMANATSMSVGGMMALIHSFLVDNWAPTPVAMADLWPFLESFLLLTLVSNIICYNLNSYLLRYFTATYLSFAGLSQPIFAAAFGYLFLNEVMSQYFWISFLAVSLGLYIYYQQELKQGLTPHTAFSSTDKSKSRKRK